MPGPELPHLIIADDHPLMLTALKQFLDRHYSVVATCGNGRELVETADALAPDIVVTDIEMPDLDGVDAATHIIQRHPKVKVIFFTSHKDPSQLSRALSIGGLGYVLKSEPPSALVQAIELARRGQRYIPEAMRHLGPHAKTAVNAPQAPDLSTLTARQLEILQLIGQGAGSKEIAHRLNVSVKTVEFHRANLKSRYGKYSIAELLVMAAEQGLIHSPENWVGPAVS